jgi:hypothetical protein
MKNKLQIFLLGMLMLCILLAYMGCAKDETTVGPQNPNTDPNAPTYPVTVTVLGPSGAPQGGVIVTLQNPPKVDSIFSAITNSLGKATLQAPAGQQVLIATIGVFQSTITVTVNASTTGNIISAPIKLVQNTALGKTLVIFAGCEHIEEVLADSAIGYTAFDTTSIEYMRARVVADSAALLTYLKQYTIVFSDCNCGDEYGYPKLARLYGRYVQQGGNIYGGHYNYMNLQYIFPGYYTTGSSGYGDSLKIINTNLSSVLGYSVIYWSTGWYSPYMDLPANSVVYAVESGTTGSASSPQGVPIIVENHVGTGKYVYTTYHNQDILNNADTRLKGIVRYFLYNMK